MKRFWREVLVVGGRDGHRIELDRRALRTPARRPLVLPTAHLAEAVAEEWRSAGDELDLGAMSHTRLASTVTDRMPRLRQPAIDELMSYLGTDLVCYRAGHPPKLVSLQEAAWDPVLAWLAEAFDAPLSVTSGLTPVEQPAQSLARLRRQIDRLDDWAMVGLHALAQALGSAALALAVLHGRLAPSDALETSLVDERFEIAQWGWDSEIDRRHRALGRDVDAAASFLSALGAPP